METLVYIFVQSSIAVLWVVDSEIMLLSFRFSQCLILSFMRQNWPEPLVHKLVAIFLFCSCFCTVGFCLPYMSYICLASTIIFGWTIFMLCTRENFRGLILYIFLSTESAFEKWHACLVLHFYRQNSRTCIMQVIVLIDRSELSFSSAN